MTTLTTSKTCYSHNHINHYAIHSVKKTIRKLGEGVYSEAFCFQEGSNKAVVKVTINIYRISPIGLGKLLRFLIIKY